MNIYNDFILIDKIMSTYDVSNKKAKKILKKLIDNIDYIEKDNVNINFNNIVEVELNSNTDINTVSTDINSNNNSNNINSSTFKSIQDMINKNVPYDVFEIKIEVIIYIILATIIFYILYGLYIKYQTTNNPDKVEKPNVKTMRLIAFFIIFAIIFYYYIK
jgi:hypothetical protein